MINLQNMIMINNYRSSGRVKNTEGGRDDHTDLGDCDYDHDQVNASMYHCIMVMKHDHFN